MAKEVELTNAAGVENVVENNVLNIFEQFEQTVGETEALDRDKIITRLIKSGNAKLVKGLHVRNVVVTEYDARALLTFCVKEFVIGDTVSSETDVFGQAVKVLGRTHNVQTSSFAVAGVMKDTPKLAIFATNVVENPVIANDLFAGAPIDVLMEYVPAGTEYANPFASNATPVVWERDKMIHHVVRLELGEVGVDMYKAHICRS